MKILWLTWKDTKHPLAGGAEIVGHEIRKRLVAAGDEITVFTARSKGASEKEELDGYTIIRGGNRFTVYWHAFKFYRSHIARWPDIVIDEVNTIPFFAKFYAKQKNILFVHQLCREIWFYQMPFPLSIIGYLIEPIYLRMLSDRKVITVSESTKRDLMRYGFKENRISIISEGIQMQPLESLDAIKKYDTATILAFGTIRAMKCTQDSIKAFEILKKKMPSARLIVAGRAQEKYGQQTLEIIAKSPYKDSIELHTGYITEEQKLEFMQRAHVIAYPSIKEGWGTMVTEANSQGTPAAGYNADGLRDSIRDGVTGILAKENTPEGLAEAFEKVLSLSHDDYQKMRTAGWQWSKEITFEKAGKEVESVLRLL